MAKRFTDTDKWKRSWWIDLPTKAKLSWIYLVDNCDHAGIWLANYSLASFQLGFKLTEKDISFWLDGKIVKLDDDKIFLPSFIEFQYGQLRENNSVHVSVANALRKCGVEVSLEEGYCMKPNSILSRLSKKKKGEVLASDYFRCTYCGMNGNDSTLFVDHIVPRTKGGDNNDGNLTTACGSCNSLKSDLDVSLFLDRHSLSEKISARLQEKIILIQSLNAPFKDLNSPKDKEEDKDKEKVKDKNKEKEKRPVCDFEMIYQNYPNKINKAEGFLRLHAQSLSSEQFENLKLSSDNYKRYCDLAWNDWYTPMHFDVWCGAKSKEVKPWHDWIDPDPSIYLEKRKSNGGQPATNVDPFAFFQDPKYQVAK